MKPEPRWPWRPAFASASSSSSVTSPYPEDGLPGSLALTHAHCGRSNCHCAKGQGHPGWSLTFMVNGRKRVERIPNDWVEDVRRRVEAGRQFKEAIAEVLASNAQPLALARRQRRKWAARPRDG